MTHSTHRNTKVVLLSRSLISTEATKADMHQSILQNRSVTGGRWVVAVIPLPRHWSITVSGGPSRHTAAE